MWTNLIAGTEDATVILQQKIHMFCEKKIIIVLNFVAQDKQNWNNAWTDLVNKKVKDDNRFC